MTRGNRLVVLGAVCAACLFGAWDGVRSVLLPSLRFNLALPPYRPFAWCAEGYAFNHSPFPLTVDSWHLACGDEKRIVGPSVSIPVVIPEPGYGPPWAVCFGPSTGCVEGQLIQIASARLRIGKRLPPVTIPIGLSTVLPGLPGEEDAGSDFMAAMSMLKTLSSGRELRKLTPDKAPSAELLDRAKRILYSERRAIVRARMGLTKRQATFPLTGVPSLRFTLSVQKLGELMAAEGRIRLAEGEWAGAGLALLESLRYAGMIADSEVRGRRNLLRYLFGLGIAGSSVMGLEALSRSVPAEEARLGELALVARAAGAVLERRFDLGRVERDEHADHEESLAVGARRSPLAFLYRTGPPVRILERSMRRNVDSMRIKRDALEARLEMISTAVAVLRFLLETGQYPPDLASLVPAWLETLPSDPFSPSRPLGYRVDPSEGMVLWSVGYDGADDGGSPEKDIVWGHEPPKPSPWNSGS